MENENVSKYRETLETELKTLKEERQEILKKVEEGKTLSIKENLRNKKIVSQIKELQDKLELFKKLDNLDKMSENLNVISNEKTAKKTKTTKAKELLKFFNKLNEDNKNDLLEEINLTEEDLNDLNKVKEDAKKELEDLRIELRLAKRRNYSTKDIEEDIEYNEKIIEKINAYKSNNLDLEKLENDLNTLANTNDNSEKISIMATYNSHIRIEKENCIREIEENIKNEVQEEDIDAEYTEVEDLDNDNKMSLKDRTKKQLEKVSNFLNRNKKKIAAIGGATVLCVSIILIAKSCTKDIKNSKNNDDLDNKTNIEQTYENANKETIKALVNKGYSEYAAMLMAENFDENTINTIQTKPYSPLVENYATEKEFNYDYLLDYEDARNTYNLTSDKVVDYVNRSVKIQETGFYEDATINDIVGVVKSIDDQTLFKKEGDKEEQTIYASLTNIYNSYSFTNETQEENIKKLDALKYFAKDGSELSLFLNEYATLMQNVLSTKGNTEESDKAKQNVYNYLDTFANTFAGNKYDIDNVNENAVIEDTYDWNVAYHSFVLPPISMFITEKNANDFACLQINMLSNYEQWAQVNECYFEEEESLTLGGK